MKQREYSPTDVIDELKKITSCCEDAELAELLGTGRQNIHQFKKGTQMDVKLRIINFLLNERASKKRD